MAKQNPAQYLAQHEQLLLDTSTTSPVDSSELLLDVNENGKRRTPDRWAESNHRLFLCWPPAPSFLVSNVPDINSGAHAHRITRMKR